MDVCHVLLGRPWQCDRDVTYKGRENIFVLEKEGKRHTLVPLKDEKIEEQTNPKILLVKEKEFLEQLQEGEVSFAIVGKPRTVVTNTRIDELPVEVQKLLEEYVDIVVDDFPDKLPPVRSISHHIDLILGASLPNKAAYRLTPVENAKISRQVQELLDKGLVRESMSPCVVPIVLSPKKGGEWRMCTDSRAINIITIRYRFPLPRMDDLMDCLSGSKYFSKIDLKSGYH